MPVRAASLLAQTMNSQPQVDQTLGSPAPGRRLLSLDALRGFDMLMILGANAITLYLANELLNPARLAQRLAGGDVKSLVDAALGRGAGDVLIALVSLALLVALARFLYQRKIFLRL
jgi:hypothetical protein